MIPLSLYIHIPWCIRKCPYCDFNSHKSPDQLPETAYVDALIEDFNESLHLSFGRTIQTIFIGGGTPSLLSANAYEKLLHHIKQTVSLTDDIEITLEANPGTIEHGLFSEYRAIGINRLSLGIQSFNPKHLRALGRIHDDHQAHMAIEQAQRAGFTNLNIDIMHSLPEQSLSDALNDLKQALSHEPTHLSWYQLTIEPNTLFHKTKPTLPNDDLSADIEEAGFEVLEAHQFHRYEISAFCKPGYPSRHNLNYWLFGDYYGIGAGAHGKLTQEPHRICRTQKHRQPKDYLDPKKPYLTQLTYLDQETLLFEFILNTSRLEQPIPYDLFSQHTGLSTDLLMPKLQQAQVLRLVSMEESMWQVSALGRRFTNDLQALFLPQDNK